MSPTMRDGPILNTERRSVDSLAGVVMSRTGIVQLVLAVVADGNNAAGTALRRGTGDGTCHGQSAFLLP